MFESNISAGSIEKLLYSENPKQTCLHGPMIWKVMRVLKSSRSIEGKDFPNFEMLDAKIASALNKIIQNSQIKKKVSLEEQKAQKEDRFVRGRQVAFMIYDYFRVTGAHDTVLDFADLFSVTLHDENIQEFDTRRDEVLLSMSKIPSNGDSSEDIGSQLSKVENHSEEEYRSETSITKL